MNKSIFLLILAVLITGCGGNIFEGLENKDTTKGIDFQISRDVDAGNWEEVLKECPDKNARAIDCAAAAMGLAGFDLDEVVTALAGVDSSSTTNDLGVFADIPLNPDAIGALKDAKRMLLIELENNPGDPDLSYQLVMVSLVNTATWLAYGVEKADVNSDISNGITPDDARTLAQNGDVVKEVAEKAVIEDVKNVLDNISAAGFSADVNSSIIAMISGDENNKGINYDGVGDVSVNDLTNYLNYELGAE